MRFSEGITALDYIPKMSATSNGRGALEIIRRIEFIPGGLLLSRARFRFTQPLNFQTQKLYLQPVKKDSHLLIVRVIGMEGNSTRHI